MKMLVWESCMLEGSSCLKADISLELEGKMA